MRSRRVDAEVFGYGDLLMIDEIREIDAREFQYVHEVILEIVSEMQGELVVEKVYVEIDVMPDDDILAHKVLKVPKYSLAFGGVSYHLVGDPRQHRDEIGDIGGGLDERGKSRHELVVSVSESGDLDDLSDGSRSSRALDIHDGEVGGEGEEHLAFMWSREGSFFHIEKYIISISVSKASEGKWLIFTKFDSKHFA